MIYMCVVFKLPCVLRLRITFLANLFQHSLSVAFSKEKKSGRLSIDLCNDLASSYSTWIGTNKIMLVTRFCCFVCVCVCVCVIKRPKSLM